SILRLRSWGSCKEVYRSPGFFDKYYSKEKYESAKFLQGEHMVLKSLAVLVASALFSLASAQSIVPPTDAKSKVDKIFAQLNKPDSPGCAVGVGIGPTTVLTAGYGMADLEHNVPITPT